MDRLRKDGAALVPPPRTHRHRYFGVLAPNSPHRAAVTALATPAQPAKQVVVQAEPANMSERASGVVPLGHAILPTPEPAPPKRSQAHCLMAVLIARIYEVFPLLCPLCGGQMRLIAFITVATQIRKILDHISVNPEPPQISPARGPPSWDDCDAQMDDGVQIEPDWDLAAQPAADYEVDHRILAVDRPGTALLRARWGFLRGVRALPRADTWPHVVEIPVRRYPDHQNEGQQRPGVPRRSAARRGANALPRAKTNKRLRGCFMQWRHGLRRGW